MNGHRHLTKYTPRSVIIGTFMVGVLTTIGGASRLSELAPGYEHVIFTLGFGAFLLGLAFGAPGSSSVQIDRAVDRICFLEGVIARLQAGIKESADIVSVVEVRIYEAWPSGDPEPVVKQTITVPYPLPMSRSRFDALEREGRAGYDPHPWKYARDCA